MMTEEEEFEFRHRFEMTQRARGVSPDVLLGPESLPQSPMVRAVSEQFGVPPAAVSLEGDQGPHRAGAGFAGDTPQEQLAYYRKYGPKADYRLVKHPQTGVDYVVGQRPSGEVFTPNPPGLDWGDVVEFSGRETAPLAAAAAAAGVSGPWGLVTGPVAYGLTRGAQEAVQAGLGTRRETLPEAGGRIGTEVAWELGGGLPGAAAQKFAQTQKGLFAPETPPSIRRDVEAIEAGRGEGMDLEPLRPAQLIDSPVIAAAARQQEQATGGALARIERQRGDLVARDLPRLDITDEAIAGQATKRVAESVRDQVYRDVPRMSDFEAAGLNVNKGFKDAYAKSNKEIRDAYTRVDTAQQAEKPIFDLTAAQQKVQDLGIEGVGAEREAIESALVDLQGRPITVAEVNKMVNVASPQGKVRRALALLEQLDPQQVDYRVVQRLRTIVGGAIKTFKSDPGDNMTAGQAKRVWGHFTDILQNPVNKENTPEYLRTFAQATNQAREQFRWLDNTRIKSALKKEQTPYELFRTFANDPALLNKEARDIVSRYSPARATRFKENLIGEMFSKPGGGSLQSRLSELERKSPGAAQWLTGGNYQAALLRQQAEQVDNFKGSVYDDVYRARTVDMDARQNLLRSEAPDARGSRELARTFAQRGGADGSSALRQTVGDALLRDVVTKDPETGAMTVDYKRYLKNLNEVETNGWWDEILTARDRTRFKAFEAYVRRTQAKSDTGSSMATGASGGKVGEPEKWLSLWTELMGHRALGWVLASDKVGDKVYQGILKGQRPKSLRVGKTLGMIAAAMAHTSAGSVADATSPVAEQSP